MTGIDVQSVPEMSSSDKTLHILDGTCWCQPVIDYEDPITGNRVFVHRKYVDGLGYEPDPTDPETHEGEAE